MFPLKHSGFAGKQNTWGTNPNLLANIEASDSPTFHLSKPAVC